MLLAPSLSPFSDSRLLLVSVPLFAVAGVAGARVAAPQVRAVAGRAAIHKRLALAWHVVEAIFPFRVRHRILFLHRIPLTGTMAGRA